MGHLDVTRQYYAVKADERLRSTLLPEESLTLEDIVAIAVNNNLELKVKEWEVAIQREAATGAALDMLPELMANGLYSKRNNTPGASSESLDPGIPPAPPSVSSQRRTGQANLTLTWNLLDFGISYFRSRQEASKILFREFELEKLRQNIVLETSKHYWNAAVALASIKVTEDFLNEMKAQGARLQKAVDQNYFANTKVLEIQDKIYLHQNRLQIYKKEFHIAEGELCRIMGVIPQELNLNINYERPITITLPDVEILERTALVQRPDLYGIDVQEAVDRDEIKATIIQYMPGISFFAAEYYDANKYLLKNAWFVIGTQAAWDLFSIPTGLSRTRQAKGHLAMTKSNRLALSLAAIAQVHIAHWIYYDDLEHYKQSIQLQDVREALLTGARRKREIGKFILADVLDYWSDKVDAEVEAWRAYGDLQYSLEQLNNAMGTPLHYRERASS